MFSVLMFEKIFFGKKKYHKFADNSEKISEVTFAI